jgi:hypothetical protein
MTPLEITAPPTLFSDAFPALVRSSVKSTLAGPELVCLEQLSITAMGMSDRPQRARPLFKKFFLSICNYLATIKLYWV